mgnify:CR=1 FL=1
MLLAAVSIAVAFTSCENEEDPNKYCWEVTFKYVDFNGLAQTGDVDLAMTIAEKNNMLEKGYLGQEVVKIEKQANEECKLFN